MQIWPTVMAQALRKSTSLETQANNEQVLKARKVLFVQALVHREMGKLISMAASLCCEQGQSRKSADTQTSFTITNIDRSNQHG